MQDLQGIYSAACKVRKVRDPVKLIMRRGHVRSMLLWCLSQFKVQGYNPESNWNWVVDNHELIYELFFKLQPSGTYGALYSWAIKSINLEQGEQADATPASLAVPSCGDRYIDLMSGLVFQGQYGDADVLLSKYSLQDITRLNWRISKLLNPETNKQKLGEEKIKELGMKDRLEFNRLEMMQKMRRDFEEQQKRYET